MPTTPYPERLGVSRPDLERVVERYHAGELKLIDLLVAVLLERGGPVAPDEAGARLAGLGVTPRLGGDLEGERRRALVGELRDPGRAACVKRSPTCSGQSLHAGLTKTRKLRERL